MKLKIALSVIALVFTIGCVQVPKTVIRVPLSNGGVATLEAPKDSQLEGLEIDFKTGLVKLTKYQAKMNPDVISQTAIGQVELIRAYTDLINTAVQAGVKAAAASAGVPPK